MEEASPAELILLHKFQQRLSDFKLENQQQEEEVLQTKNLLRFLRARSDSLNDAEIMFRNHIKWREENKIDQILKWQTPPEYRANYWPLHVTGFDSLGNPVLVIPMGSWDPRLVGIVSYDVARRYFYQLFEFLGRLIQNCSKEEKTMKQFTAILDMKGMTWRNVTTIDSIQLAMEMFQCFEVNYPETLRICFFVNMPYVFDIVFRLVKPLLSTKTQNKLRFITGLDTLCWRNEFCQVMGADQFPQKYGGDLPDSEQIDIYTDQD